MNTADLRNGAPANDAGMTDRDILGEVCTPWCIFVICNLDAGPMRFTELKRAVDGISQRMLTVSLRTLEREGLVLRTVDAGKQIKVTYALTEHGQSLAGPAKALVDWAREHIKSGGETSVRNPTAPASHTATSPAPAAPAHAAPATTGSMPSGTA